MPSASEGVLCPYAQCADPAARATRPVGLVPIITTAAKIFLSQHFHLSEGGRLADPRSGRGQRSVGDKVPFTLRRFFIAEQGLAVVEFALVLPFLILLFMGVVDVTRYILIVQKTEKLANTVADVTAQSATITKATLDQVFLAASDIMSPYTMGSDGHVIVSSLYRDVGDDDATVNWRYEGGGTLASTSQLGAVGNIPTMPTNFTFDERENVIAAEVFFRFSPLLSNPWFGTTTIYRTAFYGPRFGALTTAPK